MTVGEFIGQMIAGALNEPCSRTIMFMIAGLVIAVIWHYIDERKKRQ